jgi:acetate kinase
MSTPASVLAINGGSSSIRFALFELGEPQHLLWRGKLDRVGMKGTNLHSPTVGRLLEWLEVQPDFASVTVIGHRVVHGMRHAAPELITAGLLAELQRIAAYDPEHLPREIELITALQRRHPSLLQVACFDTAFHRSMPQLAKLLPIPRRYQALGVERYGFHGLSYSYLMDELLRLGDPAATQGRVILAHLGNGASMAAVSDGKSIDTSMGFTPTSGLLMSTRSGDLDPGLLRYLAQLEGMDVEKFQHMVNHESGLLGVSEISADVRDLLAREADDVRAEEAVALFCYQAKKWLGSFAAALGGLDTLVFAGGIGENAPLVRARICQGLEFLGIHLDESRNAESAAVVSTVDSPVTVRVIRTDEELMIARSVSRCLETT